MAERADVVFAPLRANVFMLLDCAGESGFNNDSDSLKSEISSEQFFGFSDLSRKFNAI